MLPELGHFCLLFALLVASLSTALPVAATLNKNLEVMALYTRPLTYFMFFLLSCALVFLGLSFVNNDFTVAYVANHSNTQLPLRYRIASVWGGHEGSLLLWIWILGLWSAAVALFSRQLPIQVQTRVLAVMASIAVGFLLFIIMTSNPFDRYLPQFPPEGGDLNPLLQDFGLIVHPPMLYMGYVGFSVAFAFAIAGLWTGQLDNLWARWARPWILAAWGFLTIGIALGSWWAYYELGWGGWWFWDPVENASFMPWLVGTALVHSLAATDKRGVFKAWTVLLAILTFSLSLLGTFLVRSGVLTSVHAFANDPERGLFILIYLCVVVGGSLSLFAWRASSLGSNSRYRLWSRESALLINNILLCVALSCVLLGTLYPLIAAAMDWRRVSVGPPYFNAFFVPLALLISIAMAIGPRLMWREQKQKVKALYIFIIASIVNAFFTPLVLFQELKPSVVICVAVITWLCLHLGKDMAEKSLLRDSNFFKGLWQQSAGYKGMIIAHFGFAVLVLGICFTSNYSVERDVRMDVAGAPVTIENYNFYLKDVTTHRVENYFAQRGHVDVTYKDQALTQLFPEKRRYPIQRNVMTEAAIDASFFRDLYVAMGEELAPKSWSMRVYHKPFIRWIWLGALLVAFGAFLAMWDKRYRRKRKLVHE